MVIGKALRRPKCLVVKRLGKLKRPAGSYCCRNNLKTMENLSFTSQIKGIPVEVCINPENFCKAYKVFELRRNGEHFQYIYQDNNTAEFFLAEDSKLSLRDVEPLIPQLHRRLSAE